MNEGAAALDGAAFLERVKTLAPLIAAGGEQGDRERRLPIDLMAALIDAGLFRMLLPRSLGGAELDPPSFARVIEAVAKIDASTAWCLCQNSVCGVSAAYLAPAAAAEIFGDPRTILAWGPGPARAVAVEGGYRVTGNWAFASGGRHATWLGGYCPVFAADGTPLPGPSGAPLGCTMLFPAASAAMTDIWHVIGLRGTASDAFSVADLFVPEAHSIMRDEPTRRRHPGRLYGFPTNTFFSCGFASLALGVARSSLDAFLELARAKTPRGFKRRLAENAVIQSQAAQAEARLRSARIYLMSTIEEIWAATRSPDMITLEQRMSIRLAATHTIQQAKSVVDDCYYAAGATAIFASSPFERRFRDMHTVAQQVQARQSNFETVGQYMLGLEPDLLFV